MMGCRVARLRSCSTSSRSEAERCVHGVMETCCEFQRYRAWTQPLNISPAQAVVMTAATGNRIDLTRVRRTFGLKGEEFYLSHGCRGVWLRGKLHDWEHIGS